MGLAGVVMVVVLSSWGCCWGQGFSKSLAFLSEGREGFGVQKGGGEFVAD